MKFPPRELEVCSNLFRAGQTTSFVQEYLMKKYDLNRSATSNFIKLVRRKLGIYKKKHII